MDDFFGKRTGLNLFKSCPKELLVEPTETPRIEETNKKQKVRWEQPMKGKWYHLHCGEYDRMFPLGASAHKHASREKIVSCQYLPIPVSLELFIKNIFLLNLRVSCKRSCPGWGNSLIVALPPTIPTISVHVHGLS